MTFALQTFTVRPPWPDELDRVAGLLPVQEFRQSPWLWVVLATGNPERLVGAAALEPPDAAPGESRLRLALRPRYRRGSLGEALVLKAVDKARSVGGLPIACQLPANQAPRELLEQAGFTLERREQLWQLSIAALHQRVAKLGEALAKRLRRLGEVWQGPPAPEHLPAIIKMLQAHGLRDGSVIRFSDDSSDAVPDAVKDSTAASHAAASALATSEEVFDRDLSNVVLVNGQVAAVGLTKDIGLYRCFTQYRAVAPEFITHASTVNPLLMARPLAACLARGKHHLLLTAQEDKQDETIHLAQKSQGRLLNTTECYRLRR